MAQIEIVDAGHGQPACIFVFDGSKWYSVLGDSAGHLHVDVITTALPSGAATEATLATLATEVKLEAVRVLLASLDGKDYATQTTLAALLTELQAKADLTETQPISAASLPLPAGAATEVTLDEIMDRLGDETSPAAGTANKLLTDILAGCNVLPARSSTFTHGNVTVGTTAVQIKATNADRIGIIIFNLGAETIYIGDLNTVTTATGYPILSNSSLYIEGYDGDVYGISGTAGQDVRYIEL